MTNKKTYKHLLAIEASTRALSVALFDGDVILCEDFLFEPKIQHSIKLLPMIDKLLASANINIKELDAIAITRGPGAFTSVRIGLATALGLAYPEKLPVLALNTLEVLAAYANRHSLSKHSLDKQNLNNQSLDNQNFIMPMLDARKGQVYAALYNPDFTPAKFAINVSASNAIEFVKKACLIAGDNKITILGEGANAYIDSFKEIAGNKLELMGSDQAIQPHASTLGRRVLEYLKMNIPLEQASPMYARQPEAVVSLEKREKLIREKVK